MRKKMVCFSSFSTPLAVFQILRLMNNKHMQVTTPVKELQTSLVVLSLLGLVEGSTAASTPDLLLVVLLLLQHLSSLAVVLLDSKLPITSSKPFLTLARRYLASNFLTSLRES